jgi:hypothetical protein
LDKRNNSKDYDFYLNQYESLWNEKDSTFPVELNNYVSP